MSARRWQHWLLLLSLVAALLPGLAAHAQAPPCAPAYSPTTGNGTNTTYAFVTQQSFTATCTGKLTTFVMHPGFFTDDFRGTGYYLVASIKNAAGTTTLATLPRTDQYFPGTYAGTVITFDFSNANVVLTSGTQYRWELAEVHDAPNPPFEVIIGAYDAGNPYAGGDYIKDGVVQAGQDVRGWTVNIAATVQTGTVASPLCAGAAVSVPFTADGAIGSGNTYTAQLSNASSSFAAPVTIGTLSSTASSGTISATVPASTPSGTGYRIRVVASTAGFSPIPNTSNLTVNGTATPTGAASQSFSAAANPMVANLAATGTAIQWYAASSGGTALASTTALVNGTNYYASQTVSGYESCGRLAVTVTLISPATTATVTTAAATDVAATAASFNGEVTADGGATITQRGVAYSSTNSVPTIADSRTINTGTTGTYTQYSAGLTASTLYYTRAYATNSVGTAYGSVLTFTTLAAAPALTSIAPTSGPVGTVITLTGTGFTNGSTVSFDNTFAATNVTYFSPTKLTATVPTGVSPTFTYAVSVSNSNGTSFGGGAFTVTSAPTVTTNTPDDLTSTSAKLGGFLLTDNGTVTERGVVYSATNATPTTANGTKVAMDNTLRNFSQTVTGLTAGTTYYVRGYGINENGTGYGDALSFTTTAAAAQDLTISTGSAAAPVSIAAGTYNNVTVTSTGFARLGGDVEVNQTLLVETGGSLSTNCQVLNGPGDFTLSAGATLYICAPEGLQADASLFTGPLRMNGELRLSQDASYVYNGTEAQATGNLLPFRVRNLTTTNANTLTLTSSLEVGQLLDIASTGDLDVSGADLELGADETGTALAVNRSTGVVIGASARMGLYFDGSVNPGVGYRHYAAAVSGSTVRRLSSRRFDLETNPAYNTSARPGSVTPFPNIFGYDQERLATAVSNLSAFDKGWFSPNTTDALQPAVGYTLNTEPGGFFTPFGTLNTGDYSRTLVRGTDAAAGYHLVGNPYPAPLDWSLLAAADRNGLDASMYVFESTSQYGGRYRSYVNGMGNPLIGSSQAFFVRVSSAGTSGTLTFRNSQRITSYARQAPVRRSTADARPQLQLVLSGQGGTDAAYLYAQAGATAGFDGAYDAAKLANTTGLNLATLTTAGQQLAIDGRADFATATAIPLFVGVPAAGRYTLSAAALANLAGTRAELVDNLTNTRTLLTQGTAYAFTTTTTTAPGRFWLSLRPAAAPLATSAAALAAQVLAYPNPAHGRFTVLRPAGKVAAAELLNSLGQRVRVLTLPTAETVVDLTGLASGVYTLRLTLDGQPVTKRVVIE